MDNISEVVSNLPDYIYDMMEDGQRVAYFEIFGEKNEEELNFEYSEEEEYLIDDQYLIDPNLGSMEIGLSFINFGEQKREPFTEFGVELNLGTLEYAITEEKCGEEKVQSVMNHILSHRKDLVGSLKRRFDEAKSVGKELKRLGDPRTR
jgi:hypothetical protein